MRDCGEVKNVSENYCANMCSTHLRLTGAVDVKLENEVYCTRRGLRSSSPLRVVAAMQIIDIFIRGEGIVAKDGGQGWLYG